MTSSRPVSWRPEATPAPWTYPLRRLLAMALRRSSAMLARMARRLSPPLPARAAEPGTLEFHAESGAPEGALYLNGELVGWISGVKRL